MLGDKEKVANYATVLADNLEKEGEKSLSNKIRGVLTKRRRGLTSLDSFATKPLDSESRMEMVEITTPQILKENIVLSRYIEEELDEFIECYKNRDNLMKVGIEITNSLLLYTTGMWKNNGCTVYFYSDRITFSYSPIGWSYIITFRKYGEEH